MGFPPKDTSVGKGPHSGELWQMQWIFGNWGNSYVAPAVRGIANEKKKKKRKGYCVEKHRSHFKPSLGSLAPNCQVTVGILQNQSSLSCFNCLKFVLWWLTGSPLKIINGSQLLKFRKCSSALGHCNNQPRKRKGLGIYEVSQFITIWEKYSRTLV